MSLVTEFGAVGDGRADDTEAVLHAVRDGDGFVRFPRGEYRITRTIEVPLAQVGWTALDGAGGTARIVMAGAGPALRFVGSHTGTGDPQTVTDDVWTKERSPAVSDLEIVGEHPDADGIRLEYTMQARLTGLVIRRVRHAVHLPDRNRNVIISGCHLYHNSGTGVFLDGVNLHQINITGCHISYNRLGGIRVVGSEVRNLQISGNDIEYNNGRVHGTDPDPTAEIYIDTTGEKASVNEIAVTGNTIQATASEGGANIRIVENPDESRPPGLWTISGNIIGSQENNLHLTGCYGITVSGNCIYSATHRNVLAEQCRQLVFGANIFRRHTEQFGTGLRFVDCREISIDGCNVTDESAEGQASAAPLLELLRCRAVTINGCQFIGGVPLGVDVRDSSAVLLTSSIVSDPRTPPRAEHCVRFSGHGDNNRIALCRLGPATGTALVSEPTAGVVAD